MATAAAMAVGWIVLGENSDNVPLLSEPVWHIATGFAAGSAIAVGWYRSIFAARLYLVVVTVIGVARSFAYLTERDAGGPAAVWFLFTLTSLICLVLLTDRLRRTTDG